MARNVWIVLALSLLCLAGTAQVRSLKEGGAFLEASSGKQWHEVVENDGSSNAEGFVARFHCPGSGGFKRIDVLVIHDAFLHYGFDAAVPPGGSVEITATDPARCQGGVDAVIFQDGHSEGDLKEVHMLYLRRQGALKALNDSVPLLNKIAAGQSTPQEGIESINGLKSSLSSDVAIESSTKIASMGIYSEIGWMLSNPQGNIRVPSDYTPSRQPSVEEIMSTNQVSRDSARASLFSHKLNEWIGALGSHLEPSQKQGSAPVQ